MDGTQNHRRSTRAAQVALTLGALIYGAVVPLLELNETHVWDPAWVPHARLHEVWQLITNSGFALLSLWWIWLERRTRLPAVIAAVITGGFLAAYVLRDGYGGSMAHSNGVEKRLAGINLGVFGFVLVNAFSLIALRSLRARERESS
jgi:hypothetical protein